MLAAVARRLAWRLRRAGWFHPAVVAPGAPGAIRRFTVFDGQMHLVAAIAVPRPVRAVTLRLPGGGEIRCPFSCTGTNRIQIDHRSPVPTDAAEMAAAVLVCDLGGGAELVLDGLGAAVDDAAHLLSARFRDMLAQAPPGALLEIGARARSGIARRDWAPPGWTYQGFDIVAGPNVDVVGDAHALSHHFPAAQFDAVMAFSVLEHLLMPWKFVVEVNRVLKPGGFGLFTTHQSWPIHDAPFDFWRFSDRAWAGLLNPATGFEILGARMGEPAFIVAERCSPTTAFPELAQAYLASFVLFRKTGPTTLEWPVALADLSVGHYPGAHERP